MFFYFLFYIFFILRCIVLRLFVALLQQGSLSQLTCFFSVHSTFLDSDWIDTESAQSRGAPWRSTRLGADQATNRQTSFNPHAQ